MRRFWYKLTRRRVRLQSQHWGTEIWVDRWERWTRPGYYFQTEIKRPGEDWQRVTIIPDQVRDDTGKLVSLRVDLTEYAGDGKQVYYIDGPSLTKQGDKPEPMMRSEGYPHTPEQP